MNRPFIPPLLYAKHAKPPELGAPNWVAWLSGQVNTFSRGYTSLLILLILWEIVIAGLVYITGGTANVYVQLMYLPIVVAGIFGGIARGLLAGVVGALLVGPLMPLSVPDGQMQSHTAWLLRGMLFVLIGLVAGGLSALLRIREAALEAYAQQLLQSHRLTLKSLAAVIDSRDDKTADHSERVAQNAVVMGQALGLSASEVESLYWAAMLHDLGKIAVPENILNKPGALTSNERAVMQLHVNEGYRILMSASAEFAAVAELVVAHHERLDGTGYPRGTSGEMIPLGSRIIAVLDVFEALTSHRPYRKPMDRAGALEVIRGGTESHFDPKVVSVFVELLEQDKITLSNQVV
jgi:hypothetical protein